MELEELKRIWNGKTLKFNSFNFNIKLTVPTLTKKILSEIGLPVCGIDYDLKIHPITNIQKYKLGNKSIICLLIYVFL